MTSTLEERETHINQSADDRKVWEMATDDPVWIARMKKLGFVPSRIKGETYFFVLPDNQLTIRRKKEVSDDKRRELSERARAMFSSRQNARQNDQKTHPSIERVNEL